MINYCSFTLLIIVFSIIVDTFPSLKDTEVDVSMYSLIVNTIIFQKTVMYEVDLTVICLFLQWQAEQDMRDNCFICSRASYDFEHTGEVSVQYIT